MAKKKTDVGSIKVYKGETLYCSRCKSPLSRWKDKDSDVMFMFHLTNSCDFSGRRFEAPLEELVEIK